MMSRRRTLSASSPLPARRPAQRWYELVVGTCILSLCGALCGSLCGPGPGAHAAPWNQDEDLAALGSLDSLLAYEDLQQAVQQVEDAWGRGQGTSTGVATAARTKLPPWQPAEPDPQLYLLTEYERGGGQTRVKRNRETSAAASAAVTTGLNRGNSRGLRRHARNPPGSSGQRLSIVNPLDVLRQRLLLEIARRRKASVPQSNREMLEGIGKRSWNPAPWVLDQQIERCLSQLSDSMKPQDKLTRLTMLYKAIEYGKCDLTSDLVGQSDVRPQQHQSSPPQAQALEQGDSNHVRDEQDGQEVQESARRDEDWTARQQASAWSRNVRAATSSNLAS